MPIRREAFDRGLDDLDEKICHFLEQHSGEAYTPEEIAAALNVDLSSPQAPMSFAVRLLRLVAEGQIWTRLTGGGIYYAARLVKQQKA